MIVPTQLRFRVDPDDVPAEKAARRLHLTEERFAELLPDLLRRGFPPPDPTTGMYDLSAIDAWRRMRHPRLFGTLTTAPSGPEPTPIQNVGEKFNAAQERRRHGRAS